MIETNWGKVVHNSRKNTAPGTNVDNFDER